MLHVHSHTHISGTTCYRMQSSHLLLYHLPPTSFSTPLHDATSNSPTTHMVSVIQPCGTPHFSTHYVPTLPSCSPRWRAWTDDHNTHLFHLDSSWQLLTPIFHQTDQLTNILVLLHLHWPGNLWHINKDLGGAAMKGVVCLPIHPQLLQQLSMDGHANCPRLSRSMVLRLPHSGGQTITQDDSLTLFY